MTIIARAPSVKSGKNNCNIDPTANAQPTADKRRTLPH